MKTVFVLFDSLNRNVLSCYNPCAQPTPAFEQLAARGVVFDNHYVGSLPCMPARRDLLTGRLSFLYRSWGPVEPFDICFPKLLSQQGIYTHLISDHYHYWEEGGCGYHNQYSSAEFVRGQERDLWKAMVQPPTTRFKAQYHAMVSEVERRAPNMVNREFIKQESDYPISQCVDLAIDFLQQNQQASDWFLQLELFDPHEPFTAPAQFRENLQTDYTGPILDWPLYDKLELSELEARELQANYQAIVAMCDHQLQRVLDVFDQLHLWDDTALIVTTDHGFLLGEHGWWGKNVMPVYDPIARIPLVICHPSFGDRTGRRIDALTQCVDLSATILDCYQLASNYHHHGYSMMPLIDLQQVSIRDYAIYGIFGGALNVTDGQHTYFRYPANSHNTLFEYTLMPVHPASYFTAEEFQHAELVFDNPCSGDFPVLKLKAVDHARRPPMQGGALADANNVLFDVKSDPLQLNPLKDDLLEKSLVAAMNRMLTDYQAPPELLQRFEL